MHVTLGCLDIFVTEALRNLQNVSALLRQTRSKGVSQDVESDAGYVRTAAGGVDLSTQIVTGIFAELVPVPVLFKQLSSLINERDVAQLVALALRHPKGVADDMFCTGSQSLRLPKTGEDHKAAQVAGVWVHAGQHPIFLSLCQPALDLVVGFLGLERERLLQQALLVSCTAHDVEGGTKGVAGGGLVIIVAVHPVSSAVLEQYLGNLCGVAEVPTELVEVALA